jgi:hypothetical protein
MNTPQKILLVQLFSNGDCLYATTIARQIKTDFAGCHLTWAIASSCKAIILNNPYVDQVLVTDDVPKDNVSAFRRFRNKIYQMQRNGLYDLVFITHIADTNQAYYDGCIRSNIFNAYPNPITVPITPVIKLNEEEIERVKQFASKNMLDKYQNVILFEFAPLSGQLNITKELAVSISESIVEQENTAVIMSSGIKIQHDHPGIVDGSVLSIRENAALTHHCNLLLGCSSGITWLCTSDASKLLPMIQLLNPDTKWVNPVSRDFVRYQLPVEKVIELTEVNKAKIVACVISALQNFENARNEYNQEIPLQFRTTTAIVYNLLCYLQFGAIQKHIKLNRKVFGNNIFFYASVIKAFIIFPFKLIYNQFRKKI